MLEKYGLRLELHADATAEPASDQVRIFLFESVRELLLNIVKHAKVHSAQISMSRLESEEIELIVADEGVGFDPAQVELHPTTGGFGLFSIRERLNYLGGRIQISAVPGQGSRFTLVAPAQLTSQSNQR
jgi:signal transduction histidine kinase